MSSLLPVSAVRSQPPAFWLERIPPTPGPQLFASPAFASRCRLVEERLLQRAPTILRYLEQLLAAQGDHADRELIQLQHDLAELLRLPASIVTERANDQR